MALLKVICWALIFIIRIRFPPGKSLVTTLYNECNIRCKCEVRCDVKLLINLPHYTSGTGAVASKEFSLMGGPPINYSL